MVTHPPPEKTHLYKLVDNLSPEPQMKITHSLLCAQKPEKIYFNF